MTLRASLIRPKMEKGSAAAGTVKPLTIVSIIVIAVLAVAVYSNSLDGKFIWDDVFLIQNNSLIGSWSNISKVFTEDQGAGSGARYGFYRPLNSLTYMVDYFLGGFKVTGYHLTCILLHIFVALCIYWLVSILFKDGLLSLLAGVFFVSHPIHVDAVAYISGRADPMSALFMLLAFIFYTKYLHARSAPMLLAVLLSYAAALLCKESSIILCALLLVYHYSFKIKLEMKSISLLAIVTIAYGALRMTVLPGLPPTTTSLLDRTPGFFVAIANYARLLILPFNLHVDYGSQLFKFSDPRAILGAIILIASIAYIVKERRKGGLLVFSIAWFFIAIVPVSNLYPINFYMAEHWLYLPSVGFFLILASCLRFLYSAKGIRILAVGLIVSLLGFYSYLTFKQNEYWNEPLYFYEKTLAYNPDSFRAHSDAAILYNAAGERDRAVQHLETALALSPDFATAYSNLAMIYNADGMYKEAVDLCKKAIRLSPDFADAYNNLGRSYIGLGRKEEAVAAYNEAIKLNPNHAFAYNNLGAVYLDSGDAARARTLFEKAIAVKADFAKAYYNLGNALVALGRRADAMKSFKKTIEIDPEYSAAYHNISVLYFHEKQYDLAARYSDEAVERGYKPPHDYLKALEPYRSIHRLSPGR